MTGDWGAYAGLFLSAFVAATLLPAASEAVLVGLVLAGQQPFEWLLLVAGTGNVLGAMVNWGLGRSIIRFQNKPWFPVKATSLARSQVWYQRYGKWSLLLSWVPVIGDPLCVVAGAMREPFPVFLLLVALAKFGRYLVLIVVTLGMT